MSNKLTEEMYNQIIESTKEKMRVDYANARVPDRSTTNFLNSIDTINHEQMRNTGKLYNVMSVAVMSEGVASMLGYIAGVANGDLDKGLASIGLGLASIGVTSACGKIVEHIMNKKYNNQRKATALEFAEANPDLMEM